MKSPRISPVCDYIVRMLLLANLRADAEALETADRLLADLAEAWQTSIDRSVAGTQP